MHVLACQFNPSMQPLPVRAATCHSMKWRAHPRRTAAISSLEEDPKVERLFSTNKALPHRPGGCQVPYSASLPRGEPGGPEPVALMHDAGAEHKLRHMPIAVHLCPSRGRAKRLGAEEALVEQRKRKRMDMRGIEPRTSRMLSERATTVPHAHSDVGDRNCCYESMQHPIS